MGFIKNQISFYTPDISFRDILFSFFMRNQQTELIRELQIFLDTQNIMLTGSGRCSLKMALRRLNISKGDEVVIPPFICPSVGDAVLEVGGIPVFGDNDKNSLNMSPKSAEEAISDKTKAIVIAHVGGIPARIHEFVELARKNNIPLVEDCAQSFGAKYDNLNTGLFGDYAFTSFGFSKPINGIGGGVLYSSKRDTVIMRGELQVSPLRLVLKKYLMLLSIPLVFNARSGGGFNTLIDKISKNNYQAEDFHEYCRNIQNIESAMALKKLKQFKSTQEKRNNNARIYQKNLQNLVEHISIESRAEPAFLYYPILLKDKSQVKEVKMKLNQEGIQVKDQDDMRFFALWKHAKFKQFRHFGESVLDIDDRYLVLPLGHNHEVTEKICTTLIRNM